MLSVSQVFKQLPLYSLGGGWKGLGWRQLIAWSSRPSIFGALLGLSSRSDGYTKPKSHRVLARKTFLGRFTAQLDHHFKSKKNVNDLSFIPYFRLVVFGILVAWFSFRFVHLALQNVNKDYVIFWWQNWAKITSCPCKEDLSWTIHCSIGPSH